MAHDRATMKCRESYLDAEKFVVAGFTAHLAGGEVNGGTSKAVCVGQGI